MRISKQVEREFMFTGKDNSNEGVKIKLLTPGMRKKIRERCIENVIIDGEPHVKVNMEKIADETALACAMDFIGDWLDHNGNKLKFLPRNWAKALDAFLGLAEWVFDKHNELVNEEPESIQALEKNFEGGDSGSLE